MAEADRAVTELLAERGRSLVGYAYLLCGDVHDAEDLVQDALVKVFARRRPDLELDSAEAYVRRAILTIHVDGWRRRVRWATRRHLVAVPVDAADANDAAGTRIDVMSALATLPDRQRACVVLRFYEDLTVPEIAGRLGLAPGTVKRYLSAGTHRLQAALGPVGDADTRIELVQEA